MKIKLFLFLLIFIFIACNKVENTSESVNSSLLIKKPIIVGDAKYDGPEKISYYHAAIRNGNIDINKPSRFREYRSGYRGVEYNKLMSSRNNLLNSRSLTNLEEDNDIRYSNYAEDNAVFTERGPTNVPGRTRSIAVDETDATGNTWYAAAVGGGVWKTIDAGVSWTELSNDLTNIAVSSVALSKSNPDVLYAGTGESWVGNLDAIDGNGIYKSINGGVNWVNVSTKDGDYVDGRFNHVSRVVVDPNNSDVVVIATYGGAGHAHGYIFKSSDGGSNWTQVRTSENRIQQIVSAPSDFNILYAAVRGYGILKSSDAGTTWTNPGNLGLSGNLPYDNEDGIYGESGGSFARLEIAVSYQDPNVVFAGIVDYSVGSALRVSFDGGQTFDLFNNEDGSSDTWLNSQGWFDNSILVNPLYDSIVYYGGIETYKATLLPGDGVSFNGASTVVSENNTGSFLNLVNIWGGKSLGTGDEWVNAADNPDLVDVEVKFGPGRSQKAYRFSVPDGSTSGVPHANYTYEDTVTVPFEVWDILADPPVQLTVSFRDNKNDGVFNIVQDFGESREYIFTQITPYDVTMSQTEISKNGGQLYKSLYLIWPYLVENGTWDDTNLPESSVKIESREFTYKAKEKTYTHITDGYNDIDSKNDNVHVDHHFLGAIVDDTANFRILHGGDGGVAISISSPDPGINDGEFTASLSGYNTTQTYGADKVHGFDQYFEGAQDNGSWLSDRSEVASSSSNYNFEIGGDGFEVITHFTDSDKMMGGAQGNWFWRTLDGGASWLYTAGSFVGYGPFISRLSTSYQDPEVVYAVTSSGAMKTSNFGESWELKSIGGTWGGSFWSGTDIEVSLANPRFVWAGGQMGNGGEIFLSKDWGETFDPVPGFANMGVITGLYSHPTEDSTAYVLFGMSGAAKVIETKDLGQTWKDITGFHLNVSGKSSKGFPDVAVYSFLVMPHNTDIMWAGTDIGLVESTDGAESWHIVDSNFPNVSTWDMKVKDQGQIVLATHGRGIWTATLDDLKDFVPNPATLPPVLNSVYQVDVDDKYLLESNVFIKSIYDSLLIKADGVVRGTFYDATEIVDKDYEFEVPEKGDYIIQAFGYKDGAEYPSNQLEITVNPILEAKTSFVTTFSDLVGDEFSLDRFRIGTQSGFDERLLNTDHPYEDGVSQGYDDGYSLTAMLNIPIIITDFKPSIKFKEVVIVEPGDGSSYPAARFYDYVIVEASKDGINWLKLINGYDSDKCIPVEGDNCVTWLQAYNTGSNGNKDMFKSREIDFDATGYFQEGDTVKVRFRLYSDDLTVAWGWGVDDLYIQAEPPVVQGIEFTKLEKNISIFPNPTNGIFSIEFSDTWKGNVECKIIDIFGREIATKKLNNNLGSSSHEIDISTKNDGVFIVQLVQDDKKTMKKIIKE